MGNAAEMATREQIDQQAVQDLDDLGPHLGADLTGAEIRYLMRHEWAETADDVLWRRSQLGLVVNREAREAVARFMTAAVGTR